MTTEAETPRLTPTQRLHEVTLAFANRSSAPPESSVTITRNAKGVHQYEVTVRAADAIEAYNLAETLVRSLEVTYPYPSENEGATE